MPSTAACSPMRDPRRSPDEAVTSRLTDVLQARQALPCCSGHPTTVVKEP
jgi:hypothetical protein